MATNTVKRSTSMPDSDTAELVRLAQATYGQWIISSPAIGSNATQVSNVAFTKMANGAYGLVAASNGTALCATGIGTIATSTTGAYLWTITTGATLIGRVCAGTTVAAVTLPTLTAGEVPIGITVIACTATGFNGGTNSLADASYGVSHVSFVGPTGMMLATENFTVVPG